MLQYTTYVCAMLTKNAENRISKSIYWNINWSTYNVTWSKISSSIAESSISWTVWVEDSIPSERISLVRWKFMMKMEFMNFKYGDSWNFLISTAARESLHNRINRQNVKERVQPEEVVGGAFILTSLQLLCIKKMWK